MTPDDLAAISIPPDTPLKAALETIDAGRRQIALVVDENKRLLGTLTDGDVRRALLAGVALDDQVSRAMNAAPTTLSAQKRPSAIRRLMRQTGFQHVPLLDGEGRLCDLATQADLFGTVARRTRVVLMAGGLGTRLRPLTETVPKPMLPVGGKPLLEQIVLAFADQGFERFTISVNYRGEMVRDHFGDGSSFGVEIEYVEEDRRMGTAGALSLLPKRPESPFIVMNGDLLVDLAFERLLEFHAEKDAAATLVVREWTHQVPYGVVRIEDDLMIGIEEKPVQSFYVNGGVYVISPDALDHLEPGQPCEMPDFLTRVASGGGRVAAWPLRDYWRDVGRIDDLEAARSEFPDVFGG